VRMHLAKRVFFDLPFLSIDCKTLKVQIDTETIREIALLLPY